MSGKADKRKSRVKKGGKMTGKEMLRLKGRMEKNVKTLKDKLKNQLKKEREIHKRELQDMKRELLQKFKQKCQIQKGQIELLQASHNQENRDLRESAAQLSQLLHWQTSRMEKKLHVTKNKMRNHLQNVREIQRMELQDMKRELLHKMNEECQIQKRQIELLQASHNQEIGKLRAYAAELRQQQVMETMTTSNMQVAVNLRIEHEVQLRRVQMRRLTCLECEFRQFVSGVQR